MPKSKGRKKGRGPTPRRKKNKSVGFTADANQIGNTPKAGDKNQWAYFNSRQENYDREPYSNRSLSSSITKDSLSSSHLRDMSDFDYKNGYLYDRSEVQKILVRPKWEIASPNALEKDCLKNRLLMLKHDEESPLGQPSFRNHINKLIKSGRHKDGILNERYRGLRPLDEEWIMESYVAYVNWCMDNINEVLDDLRDSKKIKSDLNWKMGNVDDPNWYGIADQYLKDLICEKIFMSESRAIWKIGKTRSKIIGSDENDWTDCYYADGDQKDPDGSDREIKQELYPAIPFVFRDDLPSNWFDICFSNRSAYVVEHEDKTLPSFTITKLTEEDDDVKRFEQIFGEPQKEALLGLGRHIGSGTCFSQTEKEKCNKGAEDPVTLNQHHCLPLVHPTMLSSMKSMYWEQSEKATLENGEDFQKFFTKRQFLWNASINKQREGHSDRRGVMRFTFYRNTFTEKVVPKEKFEKFKVAEHDWTMFNPSFDITVSKDLTISYNGDFTVLEDLMHRETYAVLKDSIIGLVLFSIKNLVRINQETVEWVERENKDREEKRSKGENAPPVSDEETEAYEARNISVPRNKKRYYYDESDGTVKRKDYNKGNGQTPMPHIRIRKHEKFKNGKAKSRWGFYKPSDFPVPVNIRPEGEYCTWETVSVGDKDMDKVLEARAEHLMKKGKRTHHILLDDDSTPSGLLDKVKVAAEVINQNLSNLKSKVVDQQVNEQPDKEAEVEVQTSTEKEGAIFEPKTEEKPWWKFWGE